ncbi:MAG: hypothetical protein WCD54_14920, partial [Pseudolabrys sp.]
RYAATGPVFTPALFALDVELAYQPPVEIGLAGDVGAKIGAALGTGMEHLRSSPATHGRPLQKPTTHES